MWAAIGRGSHTKIWEGGQQRNLNNKTNVLNVALLASEPQFNILLFLGWYPTLTKWWQTIISCLAYYYLYLQLFRHSIKLFAAYTQESICERTNTHLSWAYAEGKLSFTYLSVPFKVISLSHLIVLMYGIVAVSYTHLDVYKRQGRNNAGEFLWRISQSV